MKRILVTGCLGQIGTELVTKLREVYGVELLILENQKETQLLRVEYLKYLMLLMQKLS